MCRWIDIAVIPGFSWPNAIVEVPFHGNTVVLAPSTDELACTASAYDPNRQLTLETGGEIVRRFLSCLSWANRGGVTELFCLGSNHQDRPGLMGTGSFGRSYWQQVEPAEFLYLPHVTDPRARRALAVYREGLSINSKPFAFLSYFKVLNILFSSGPDQKAWINANLRYVRGYSGSGRLAALSGTPDIGSYLYHQGRCAVAHAFDATVVDPDNYEETERLSADLPLIQELAEVCIEREFRVPSRDTFWQWQRRLKPCPYRTLLRLSDERNGRRVYAAA